MTEYGPGVCPLLQDRCIAQCAWFDELTQQCAIALIGDSLANMADGMPTQKQETEDTHST